jgi:thiamine transport system substrate-binding protein
MKRRSRRTPTVKAASRLAVVTVVIALAASACSSDTRPDEIVLLTHDSFALSESTLAAFTDETGVTIVQLPGGDTGSMVNQAILTSDNPIADVLFGVDTTFLSRAVDEGIFIPYTPDGAERLDPSLRVDGDVVTPIDFGDVCINYDIDALAAAGVDPPQRLEELTEPAYRDLLVVQDPATSSPGLSFLLATIARFPEGTAYDWRAYWSDLFANGVRVVSGWEQAYNVEFTRAGGDRPLVVSYASSPPAEVLFGELTEAPTAILEDSCFRQVEYAGILEGTAHEATARELVDFLISQPVQEDIPLNMFVYPAATDAALPPVFVEFTTLPSSPSTIDSATIDANRQRWIEEWTSLARA